MNIKLGIVRALADGGFRSGEELAATYKITRAAVWKHISEIRKDWGLSVFAVRGKGYRLAAPLELLDRIKITQALSDKALEWMSVLEIKGRIDSTNSYLMSRLAKELPSGCACLAEQQTAGRGRRGRTWVSPFGSNIYLSIYWKFDVDLAGISGLSLAAGLAVVKSLKEIGLLDIGLKWPNDVVWNNRKLAGLLLEVTGEQGGPSHVVLGVGLNSRLDIHQASAIDQPWVDLHSLPNGADISRNLLAARILEALLNALSRFAVEGFGPLVAEWKVHDVYYGETVMLQMGNSHVVGTNCGVSDSGALLLREAGTVRAYHGGELSLRVLRRV
ncbi:MAG: bifunctional biotin--[acetyl-CoA-carboxylase] ligase/biotin operon repressor BirA [Gammaproteobacteria bacterium]|nr:bifunctional biotin--[acetyl-CoA-carboxylase] ligase/biotin operon repressor BirA [Gammaproteobacteria bacterium]